MGQWSGGDDRVGWGTQDNNWNPRQDNQQQTLQRPKREQRKNRKVERERTDSQSFLALVLPSPVGVVALRNSPGASKRAAGCEDGLAVIESGSVEDNGQLQVVFGEERYLKFFAMTEGMDGEQGLSVKGSVFFSVLGDVIVKSVRAQGIIGRTHESGVTHGRAVSSPTEASFSGRARRWYGVLCTVGV